MCVCAYVQICMRTYMMYRYMYVCMYFHVCILYLHVRGGCRTSSHLQQHKSVDARHCRHSQSRVWSSRYGQSVASSSAFPGISPQLALPQRVVTSDIIVVVVVITMIIIMHFIIVTPPPPPSSPPPPPPPPTNTTTTTTITTAAATATFATTTK